MTKSEQTETEKTTVKRSMWSGTLSVGLINIPVKMVTMINEGNPFKLFHRCGSPIKQQKLCVKEGIPVQPNEIVRGYEMPDGTYVMFEQEEIDAIKAKNDKVIAIDRFVDKIALDVQYFNNNYLLIPASPRHAYFLLLSALEVSGKAAIGRVVLRSKEYPVAIRAYNGGIVLTTMHFSEEMIQPTEISALKEREQIKKEEIDLAVSLINNLTKDFDLKVYRNTAREEIAKAAELKKEGKLTVVVPKADKVESTEMSEIMDYLRQSIAATDPKNVIQPEVPAEA